MCKKGHIPWNKGIPCSEKTKEKISKSECGENHWNYGGHLSNDAKKKISKSNKGKPKSEETKKKISESKKGLRHTEEWKKNHSERMRGINHPLYGKKHSEETKNKIKENHDDVSGKNNPMYGKIRPFYGKRIYYNSPLQGEICFRSSYELAYAKYLDNNHILWYYEYKTFELDNTTYTPDFFLVIDNKFIEIKGYMRSDSQIKINEFTKKYNYNFEILYKEDLIDLGIDLDDDETKYLETEERKDDKTEVSKASES